MIRSKKELMFFIMADMMMNRDKFKWTLSDRVRHLLCPDHIMLYLKHLRYCQYYTNLHLSNKLYNLFNQVILSPYHKIRFRQLGLKLGFSIGYQTLDYGTIIPHYGTIVIGKSNRIGKFAVLHTCICITDNGKVIGDAFYASTGVKITNKLKLGDNVSVGANSLVNKSFGSNIMIAGAPATEIKKMEPWYIRDGKEFIDKVNKVEALKKNLFL